jgi:hypothetical protein
VLSLEVIGLAKTCAEIVENPGARLPFKVVFSKDGVVIADRPVASREAGDRLIGQLLPLLQRHEDA